MTDDTPVPLSLETLDALPPAVERPSYAREDLSPGIVHLGPGNFHRAHQGIYLDRLMNAGRDRDWGIVGASVMPGDATLRDALIAQDCLTTVVEQTGASSEARVTGVMLDYVPPADGKAILAALADPAIRIVSMTVTEGGYYVDAESGHFDATHEAIRTDAARIGPGGNEGLLGAGAARPGDTPRTVFGLIVRALRERREAGHGAFTVMSCDNLPHNGRVAREAVVGTARLADPDLADWIGANARFPNAMVDRIVPATGDRERRLVAEEHGVADRAPVFCEDYLQWVLEDDFVDGRRPSFETVGVEIVEDVTPWELMKIRILNGGHATIAYPAGLLDVEFVDAAIARPAVRAFLEKVEREEILPIVPPVPNTDLERYLGSVVSRLENPKIGDTVRRLCFDGSNRQPKFIVPSVRDRLAQGLPVEGLALESALWCRYCFGETEGGRTIEPNDPSWDALTARAREAKEDPHAWLAMREVYGTLGEDERFAKPFGRWLEALWRDGTEAVLERYLGS